MNRLLATLFMLAAVTLAGCASSSTTKAAPVDTSGYSLYATPTPEATSAAPSSPSASNDDTKIRVFGATADEMSATHAADSAYDSDSAWDPTPGLGPDYRHDDRYYAVSFGDVLGNGNRILLMSERFAPGTNQSSALAYVRQHDVPADAHLVWKAMLTNGSGPCYVAQFTSKAIAHLTSDTNGAIRVEFDSDQLTNYASNYQASSVTGAEYLAMYASTPSADAGC